MTVSHVFYIYQFDMAPVSGETGQKGKKMLENLIIADLVAKSQRKSARRPKA